MLSSAFNIARSGLAAETLQVEMAASNIANASSVDYVPKKVEQTTLGNSGGVTATVRPVAGAFVSPAVPNVDIVRETTTLIQAQAAYEANLAVIVTIDQMTESIFDIFDNNHSD